MTEDEAYRALQVRPDADPRVVVAAYTVLRELALADPGDGAPRRLVELDRARNTLRDRGRLDGGRRPDGQLP